MKRIVLMLLAMALVISALAGCSKSEGQQGAAGTPEEEFYVTYNGQKLYVGLTFADIEAGLGEKSKPDEEIKPCGDDNGWRRYVHTYTGVVVWEDENGKVVEIDLTNMDGPCEGKFRDTFAPGDTFAAFQAAMGEPENADDTEYTLRYRSGEAMVEVLRMDPAEETFYNLTIFVAADRGY